MPGTPIRRARREAAEAKARADEQTAGCPDCGLGLGPCPSHASLAMQAAGLGFAGPASLDYAPFRGLDVAPPVGTVGRPRIQPVAGIQPVAPIATEPRAHARLRDLHAVTLANAASALEAVTRGLASGMDARDVKDLALTASTLMRATKLVEAPDPDDPMTPEQLEHELKHQQALAAELKRRTEG